MSRASTDLIVNEDQLQTEAEAIESECRRLNVLINDYISIMSRAKLLGLMRGETAEAMRAFISYAKQLQGTLSYAGEVYSKKLPLFLHDVDVADNYLF